MKTEKNNIFKDSSELRRRAEEINARSPENIDTLLPEEAKRVLHELRVHQIELEMQNEELRTSQAELDAALARYFDLYDLAPVGYLTISKQGLILEANLTAATLFGEARGLLVKHPLSQFIIYEDQDIYYLHRDRLFETRQPQSCELRMLKKDGTAFWVNLAATVAEPPSTGSTSSGQVTDGTPVCRIVISDITESKRAVAAIVRMSQEWQRTFDSMSEAVWILDKEQTVLRSNKAAERYFHRPCADMVGKHCWEIAHGMPEPISECPTIRARKSLHHESMVLQIGDGWFDITVDPILDADGNFAGAVHVVIDITERKKAEDALRQARARLELAQCSAGAGMWEWDIPSGRLVWSRELFSLFGLDPDKEQATFDIWRKVLHPDDVQSASDRIEQVLRDGSPLQNEYRVVLPNGQTRWLSALGNTVYGKDGVPLLMSGICLDITGRKKMEEEKANLELQLRESQKMEAVGQLADGISHDFNNLLSVINGYAEVLLMNPDLNSENKSRIEEMLNAGERAAGLTRQLLIFSRHQTVEFKIICLDEIITGIEKMLRRLIREDIIVNRKIGSSLWQIKADPGNIEQVVMNLVINASDAMPDGGTLIVETENVKVDESNRLSHHSDIKPGSYVVLSVSDTGCGMDDKVRERIFEPFFTTKEVGKGTGLGLATVYGIVKQSDAYIDVQSELGKGTRFRIYFPQAVDESAVDEKQQETEIMPRGSETILLVEDGDSLRAMLQNFLESIGYAVHPSGNGKEALELAENHRGQIHLLLTDVVMPGMNGFELAKQLKISAPEIKLLFMSGYNNPTNTERMMKISDNFIQKPIVLHTLAVKLREILG